MRKLVCLAMVLSWAIIPAADAEGLRIGAGAHYWTALEDVDADDIEDDGLSYLASVQFFPDSLLKLQADLEIFPDGFAGQTETTYAPQAFALVGYGIYGGLGVGINYADGDFADDPFYTVRVGINLELLPFLHLDVNANYQFVEWEKIETLDEDVDTDTITLGAAVRLDL
ncbi:MAG: hypothetical protein JXB04_01545 [Kiritimatiellae bacterium]|nr:hypothetical protein [Kiritimatiellia bacterium]